MPLKLLHFSSSQFGGWVGDLAKIYSFIGSHPKEPPSGFEKESIGFKDTPVNVVRSLAFQFDDHRVPPL